MNYFHGQKSFTFTTAEIMSLKVKKIVISDVLQIIHDVKIAKSRNMLNLSVALSRSVTFKKHRATSFISVLFSSLFCPGDLSRKSKTNKFINIINLHFKMIVLVLSYSVGSK